MIRRHISAAIALRDGLAGKIIDNPSRVKCILNGNACIPAKKTGGYLVFSDLEEYEYELLISYPGYKTERISFAVKNDECFERTIDLKPDATYRFPADTAFVKLKNVKEDVWVGMVYPFGLRLAQEPGDNKDNKEIRFFSRAAASLLPIPGTFLIDDEKHPELIFINYASGETLFVDEPMKHKHARGKEFIPVMRYSPDDEGIVDICFPYPVNARVFVGGKLKTFDLISGSQEIEL